MTCSLSVQRSPRGADLQLPMRIAIRHGPVGHRMGSGDGATECCECQIGICQGFLKPRPAHIGKNGIASHFRFKCGLGEDHNSPLTLPRILALWVVEKYETSRRNIQIIHNNIGGKRRRVGSQPLWGGRFSKFDFRPRTY